MKATLRIVSAALLLGAAACAGADATLPETRAPGQAVHDGLGYLGGGGRSAVQPQPRSVSVP